VLPTMTGQRSVVQKRSVMSALSAAGCGGGGFGRDAGLFTASIWVASRRSRHRVADRQIGTYDCGSGSPEHQHLAPGPRSSCTRRKKLLFHLSRRT